MIKKRNVKSLIIILLLIVSVMISACDKANANNTASNTEVINEEEQKYKDLFQGVEVKVSGIEGSSKVEVITDNCDPSILKEGTFHTAADDNDDLPYSHLMNGDKVSIHYSPNDEELNPNNKWFYKEYDVSGLKEASKELSEANRKKLNDYLKEDLEYFYENMQPEVGLSQYNAKCHFIKGYYCNEKNDDGKIEDNAYVVIYEVELSAIVENVDLYGDLNASVGDVIEQKRYASITTLEFGENENGELIFCDNEYAKRRLDLIEELGFGGDNNTYKRTEIPFKYVRNTDFWMDVESMDEDYESEVFWMLGMDIIQTYEKE